MRLRRLFVAAIVCTAAQTAAVALFRRRRRRYAGRRRHVLVTQGGAEVTLTGTEIEDAIVSVMMGGVVLDLRDCELTRRPARLDVLVVMGGIDLLVPASWQVRLEVEPMMGGIRDRRGGRPEPARTPDLIVSGRAVMGGLDVSDHSRARCFVAPDAPAGGRSIRGR